MKRLRNAILGIRVKSPIYLIGAFSLILSRKSVVFANGLESKINYLLELSKSNISQANDLMSLFKLWSSIIGGVFFIFIIFVLNKIFRQISINKDISQKIKVLDEKITTVATEITEIKNQIQDLRDQNLTSSGITEEFYAKLLDEILGWEVIPNMNIIKTLVWRLFKPREYKAGLEKLRKVFSNITPLMDMVKERYHRIFMGNIDNLKLLTWIYEMKEKGKKIEDLLYEEAKKIIEAERAREGLWRTIAFERYYNKRIDAAKKLLEEKGEELPG